MPFDIALTARPPGPSRLSELQAWALFPPDPARRHETPMLLYALGFYGCYLVAIAGWVPMWAAGVLGTIFLFRNFNQAHEMMHADVKGERRGHPARALLIVQGPLYPGYREMRELHLLHHREEGTVRDPDERMMSDSPLRAFFWCVVQPELYVVEYVRRFGVSRRFAAGMAARSAVYFALMWLGGWWGFVMYNAMTRVGNGLIFFVFSWVVHQPYFWGQVRPPRLPDLVAWLWVKLVSFDNLVGIRFHFLHHVFPHIPDRHLPEVSRRLAFD
jgi:fatty acid desaturase